jgi:hypothetical protein
MPQKYFNNPMTMEECLNYGIASCKQQSITSFTSDVTVTLRNPHRVTNNTNTASAIAIKMRYDSGLVVRYFAANQQLVCDPILIGSSSNGTTCTNVVVDGVD